MLELPNKYFTIKFWIPVSRFLHSCYSPVTFFQDGDTNPSRFKDPLSCSRLLLNMVDTRFSNTKNIVRNWITAEGQTCHIRLKILSLPLKKSTVDHSLEKPKSRQIHREIFAFVRYSLALVHRPFRVTQIKVLWVIESLDVTISVQIGSDTLKFLSDSIVWFRQFLQIKIGLRTNWFLVFELSTRGVTLIMFSLGCWSFSPPIRLFLLNFFEFFFENHQVLLS
jgi:hypothetical protein